MRIALAVLLLVAVATLALALADGERRPAGEPAADTEPATPTPASRASSVGAPTTTQPTQPAQRDEARTAGLFGVVLDYEGHAIERLLVRLVPPGGGDNEAVTTWTDADGAFAFARVHGRLRVHTYNRLSFSQLVEIAPGERRDVVLRADEPCVLLHGTLLRGGEPMVDRSVYIAGTDREGDVEHESPTDEHGYFHHLLRPGTYELSVAGPPTAIAWSIKGNEVWVETAGDSVAHERIVLTAVPRRVRRDIHLCRAGIDVRVRTPAGKPAADVLLTLAAATDGSRTRSRRTDEHGRTRFDELPAGEWHLRGTSPMHLPSDPRAVTVRAGDALIPVSLTMTPAGSLLFKPMHDDELLDPISIETIELHLQGGTVMPGKRHEGSAWIHLGTMFRPVPVGQHQLRCEDRMQADGSVLLAPFEPLAPRPVTIAPGEPATLSLPVERRPMLWIYAHRGAGVAEDARITVRSPTARLRSYPSSPGVWCSAVPPGDYTVHVHCRDNDYEQRVAVLLTDVEHAVHVH